MRRGQRIRGVNGENAHQPARGIETRKTSRVLLCYLQVRTPINPPEGLKLTLIGAVIMGVRSENAHQPARGIETGVDVLVTGDRASENAHQPARGIETLPHHTARMSRSK